MESNFMNNKHLQQSMAYRALVAIHENAPDATGFDIDRQGNVQVMTGRTLMQVSPKQQAALNEAFTPLAAQEGHVDRESIVYGALSNYVPLINEAERLNQLHSFVTDTKMFKNKEGEMTRIVIARSGSEWRAVERLTSKEVQTPRFGPVTLPNGRTVTRMQEAYAYVGAYVRWDAEAEKLVLSTPDVRGTFVVLDPTTKKTVEPGVLFKARKQRALDKSPLVFRILRQRGNLVARLYRCASSVSRLVVDQQNERIVRTPMANPWFFLTPEQAEQVKANDVYKGMLLSGGRVALMETDFKEGESFQEHESDVSGRPWTYMTHPRALELINMDEVEHMRLCMEWDEDQSQREKRTLIQKLQRKGEEVSEDYALVHRDDIAEQAEQEEVESLEVQLEGIEKAAFAALKAGQKLDLASLQRDLREEDLNSNYHA